MHGGETNVLVFKRVDQQFALLAELSPLTLPQRSPTLGIVIPVFKHSVLVTEAISCALREARCSDGMVIIVNDGCPYEETHASCLTFAEAFPDHVDYIKTPNGGLSAARNRGIRYALQRFPSIKYVYLLDADNRVNPGAMQRVTNLLETTNADWIYPNIDKFGMEWSGDFSPPYSVLRHLFQNICEAGSLIHRRVFDAGIFFDENMRQGYEDWEFWLQCCEAGFRGRPCSDSGFQYRARRESMLRDSHRSHAELVAYIRRKHKNLYDWKNIVRLEHEEAPRYCIVNAAHRRYVMTSMPAEISLEGKIIDIDTAFWANHNDPTYFHFPNFMVFTDDRVIKELRRLRLADWIFWQLEDLLERAAFVFVRLSFDAAATSFSIDFTTEGSDPDAQPFIVATTRKCIEECALDPLTIWIDSLKSQKPEPNIAVLRIAAPFARSVIDRFGVNDALAGLFSVLYQFRNSPLRAQADLRWEWREPGVIPTGDLFRSIRTYMNAFAPLGGRVSGDEREIAFVLPVLSFGGVEQVATQLALQFKMQGWRTRVIVTQANTIPAPERLLEAFDSFLFLNDPVHAGWNQSGQKYYGHDLQRWMIDGRIDRLVGLLAGCIAVVNFQSMHCNEAMGWLRRQGVMTINSLHLIDRDTLGAPVGHPYLMLAYEHAYDLIVAPSQQLLDFCNAAGVPEAKLILLENAPTFDVSKSLVQKRTNRYRQEAVGALPTRPLRVIALGRLDRQKGVERLAALISTVKAEQMPIEWRLVGSRVIVENDAPLGLGDLSGVEILPAVYDRAAVIEHLLWADVAILLSHWEGSPLLVLEAQSLGVIPLVTDAGAVQEMITTDKDGLIIPNGSLEQTVAAAVASLRGLLSPSRRLVLSTGAMRRAERLSWKSTSATLVERVMAEADGQLRYDGRPSAHPFGSLNDNPTSGLPPC
jgi:glycosyltransferase involved in cell wall biosynthesis